MRAPRRAQSTRAGAGGIALALVLLGCASSATAGGVSDPVLAGVFVAEQPPGADAPASSPGSAPAGADPSSEAVARPGAGDSPSSSDDGGGASNGADSAAARGGGGGDTGVDGLMREFMTTSRAIEGRAGDEAVDMERTASGGPSMYSALKVTKDDNPLLSDQCRKRATEFSVDKLADSLGIEGDEQAVAAAAAHIQEHIEDIKRMGGQITYSRYLRTIATCEEFCAPLVEQLVECHTLSVARLDHGIVLFEIDRYRLDDRYTADDGLLARVTAKLEADPELKVLLIGRASKIGDLRYNRRLSAQRALAVGDALEASGIDEARIETEWFGWEPPQVTASMAREYGLGPLYERRGGQALNQSVMVVLYPRGGHEHGIEAGAPPGSERG